MRYRRATVSGACYFFTLNLQNRKQTLLIDEIILLKSVINSVKKSHPFKINAMVIMPNHLHALWTFPQGDSNFPLRWRLIKSGFSSGLPKREPINQSRQHKGERGIWQRRFWEHLIRDEDDYNNHINYIHQNPVKHRYVTQASDWPHSTVHRQ